MKLGLMFVNSGPFSNPELLGHLAQRPKNAISRSILDGRARRHSQGFSVPIHIRRMVSFPAGAGRCDSGSAATVGVRRGRNEENQARYRRRTIFLPVPSALYVAKELATLDLLSGGRMIFGIGSGWLKEEFEALGLDFHVRGARTDEAIRSLRVFMARQPVELSRQAFRFRSRDGFPKPAQKERHPDPYRRSFSGCGAPCGTSG